MSSGLDVYLEKLGGSLPEFPKVKKIERTTVSEGNKLDAPQGIVYYLRVNDSRITWGKQKQIDDNICIVYYPDNTFKIIKL